jgi:hypothetical protein
MEWNGMEGERRREEKRGEERRREEKRGEEKSFVSAALLS